MDSTLLRGAQSTYTKTLFDFCQKTTLHMEFTLAEAYRTKAERAINRMKNNKAPGVAGVQAELLKHGGVTILDKFTSLFNQYRVHKSSPED